jgi:hypothetical protein
MATLLNIAALSSGGAGLLLPGSAGNALASGNAFDSANWVKQETTVSANITSAPGGSPNADLIVPSANALGHSLVQASISYTSGQVYRLSVFAKASGYNWLRMAFGATVFGASTRVASINVQSGTAGTVQSGVTAIITPVGNGWFRCIAQATAGATTTDSIAFSINNADNVAAVGYAGNLTSGILLWGAQHYRVG